MEHPSLSTTTTPSVLITGGAGYIGSLLTGVLLQKGYRVTVLDDLLFGSESLLGHWHHPGFRFVKGDVLDPAVLKLKSGKLQVGQLEPESYNFIIHLAAIVGFPACQAVGEQVSWRYNVEAVKRAFELAEESGAERFVFSSTYSNYGLAPDGEPVNEDSPLYPQSIYAETKIASEEYLQQQSSRTRCAPVIFRFATLFGVSPRTRFDLIINQFVQEAISRGKLVIYQRGYARSFVHVRDVCSAIELALAVPGEQVRGQVFNVGSDELDHTKDEIVALVQQHVTGTTIEYKDLSFGGDMRDIRVSFSKIRRVLSFVPQMSVTDGICEVRDALRNRLIVDATDSRYRNAQFIIQ